MSKREITPDRLGHIGGVALVTLDQGTTATPVTLESLQKKLTTVNYVYNPNTLSYDPMVQPSTGSGGGAGSSSVDASLTSAGSTRLVGQVTVANPTTAVSLSSGAILGVSTAQIGWVAQGTPGGSSAEAWWVRTVSTQAGGAGSTTVVANLTSAGSTKLVGLVTLTNPATAVTISNPTTSVSLSSQHTITVGNPTTSVSLSSQITASVTGTTSVNIANSPTVIQGAGSTSVAPWYVISTASAGAGSTTVDANLSSAGSTRQVGLVGLLAGSSANTVGAIAQGAGSTSIAPWYVISTASAGAGSTTVDANLSSAGSTKLVGLVGLSSQITVTASGSTAVDATLSSAGSTRLVGKVDVNSITTSTGQIGSVALVSGSTAFTVGSIVLASGSTSFLMGAVAVSSGVILAAGSSANTIGNVAQGPGSSANFWFMQSVPFSSGNVARTSVSTTVDVQIIAANANRKALVVANGSTTQTVALGLTTAVMTTALANLSVYLSPAQQVTFGLPGSNQGFPLYTGPIRGINLTSTTVAGGVVVTEFT